MIEKCCRKVSRVDETEETVAAVIHMHCELESLL